MESDLRERLRQEAEVWDRNVDARGTPRAPRPYARRFGGEPVVEGLRRLIGPSVAGMSILDVGCGVGDTALAFALDGARVVGIDVSGKAIQTAADAARRHGLQDRATFQHVALEDLPTDRQFDLVFGCGSLHHVSLPHAMRQAHRLVKPGGAAVFSEPYGNNPLLELARRKVTYPGQEGHAVDRPLTRREIEEAAAPYFQHVELEPHRLLEVLPWFLETALEGASPRAHRLLRPACEAVRRVFRAVDAALLLVMPRLGDYCQIVNVRLTGPR